MDKIDIHCHIPLWGMGDTTPESTAIDTIKNEMSEYNVTKTVLLASYLPYMSSGISNYRLYDWIRDLDQFNMFGSLDFEHYFLQGYNELRELCDQELIHGIKIYTCSQAVNIHGTPFDMVMKLAGQYKIPVMFQIGEKGTLYDIKNLKSIAAEYPDIKIIFNHMGGSVEEMIETIKVFDSNVYTDMGGLIDSSISMSSDKSENPVEGAVTRIKRFLEECGSNRLLFGTCYPFQTYKDSIYLIETAMKDWKLSEREDVYYYNALELLEREMY